MFSFASGLPNHQPLPFQLFDDEKESLRTYIIHQAADGSRKVSHLGDNGKVITVNFDSLLSSNSKCQDKSKIANLSLSSTHGGAFIDLNMDCKPDLFIESTDSNGNRNVETYFLLADNSICLVSVDKFSNKETGLNASSFSFQDLLRLGSNHAIAVDVDNNIHVMINKYNLPNPSDTAESLCKGKELLGNDGKYIAPFDGVAHFANTFTDVRVSRFNSLFTPFRTTIITSSVIALLNLLKPLNTTEIAPNTLLFRTCSDLVM